MTNVELARRVGISAPPCLRRVRALEKAGFINGYHALLNEKQLGFDLTAFAMVGLTSQAEADLAAFEEQARGWRFGAGMPHAFRRNRLPVEMRRSRLDIVSRLHHP